PDPPVHLDRGRKGLPHLLQPPLVRVHRHLTGGGGRSGMDALPPSRRPRADGGAMEALATDWRAVFHRVPLPERAWGVLLVLGPGASAAQRKRRNRRLVRDPHGYLRPEAA